MIFFETLFFFFKENFFFLEIYFKKKLKTQHHQHQNKIKKVSERKRRKKNIIIFLYFLASNYNIFPFFKFYFVLINTLWYWFISFKNLLFFFSLSLSYSQNLKKQNTKLTVTENTRFFFPFLIQNYTTTNTRPPLSLLT
jgi:hypothetical protein